MPWSPARSQSCRTAAPACDHAILARPPRSRHGRPGAWPAAPQQRLCVMGGARAPSACVCVCVPPPHARHKHVLCKFHPLQRHTPASGLSSCTVATMLRVKALRESGCVGEAAHSAHTLARSAHWQRHLQQQRHPLVQRLPCAALPRKGPAQALRQARLLAVLGEADARGCSPCCGRSG